MERVVETQVLEYKARTTDASAAVQRLVKVVEAAKAQAKAAADNLAALGRAQKIGPPTQIEAARDALRQTAAAAKDAQAKLTAANKAAASEAKAATAAEKERARAVKEAHKAAGAAAKEAAERASAAMENAVAATRKYAKEIDAARHAAERLSAVQDSLRSSRIAGAVGAAKAGLGRAASAIGTGATIAVGAAGAAGAGVLQQVVSRGSEFAAQRAALAASVGSREEADARIAEMRGVRGLNVGEGISAATRLGGLGLNNDTRSVKNLASIAGGTPGKGVNDVAEALADAGTGEFERLKEFGIKAKVDGDNIAVTFKGVTETIKKGSESWQEYLNKIAESDFGNTLELKANSLAGGMEHLQDKITAAASAIYDSGLGDAVQAVVADIGSYFEISGDGAKGLGQVLGDAVKSLWAKIKELIGPVSELPGKIEKIIKVALTFAEAIMQVAGVLGSIIDTLGATGTAFTALGVAGLAALGPWGAAAAAAVAAISLIGDALSNTTEKARLLQKETERVAQTAKTRKELSEELEGDFEDYRSENRVAAKRADLEKRKSDRKRASGILSPAALKKEAADRAADLVEMAKEEADIAAEEERIARNKVKRVRDKAAEEKKVADAKAAEEDAASEKISDEIEFDALGKKKRTPSQQKRYLELSKKLDKAVKTGGGAAKKAEVSAFGAEVEAEVKKRSQDAGRVAGARAARNGATTAEADKIALQTEKETAARLRTEVDKGGILPGQINSGILALAQVEDVASRGTPPPIAVTNIRIEGLTPTLIIRDSKFDMSMREAEVQGRRVVTEVMGSEVRNAVQRITSGVNR